MICVLAPALAGKIVVRQGPNGRIVFSETADAQVWKKSVPASEAANTVEISLAVQQKVAALCRTHDLRQDLVLAVIRAESSFNPYAVSRKGAVGMMQLMHETAHQYGVRNRFNIDQNLEGGIRHLKKLATRYNGDLPLVLAAYNAGSEAVEKYGGVPPYNETRQYVQRVMSYMGLTYSSSSLRRQTRIFKYTTKEGRIMLSDTPPPPSLVCGQVEIID